MSVQFDSSRNRWVVRWYEGERQRSRRFADQREARDFEAEQRAAKAAARQERDATLAGELARLRARVETLEQQLPDDARSSGVYRLCDTAGRALAHRGPAAGRQRHHAPWIPNPRGGMPSPRRGSRSRRVPEPRRPSRASGAPGSPRSAPYLTEGALEDLETHGRKRLLPHLAHLPIGEITERHVRDWMTEMTEQQRSRSALGQDHQQRQGRTLQRPRRRQPATDLLPRNPCRYVAPLPIEHRELDYLRLGEIDRYLRACPAHYRPLAELLIGTGARISEALALTWPDIDLDHGTVQIQRQRARHGDGTAPDQGQACPHRPDRPAPHRHTARATATPPTRQTVSPTGCSSAHDQAGAATPTAHPRSPPSRRTVHEWHHYALRAAGLPRHATARAAPHRRGQLADDRPQPHLRRPPTRPPLHHHHRTALRPPRTQPLRQRPHHHRPRDHPRRHRQPTCAEEAQVCARSVGFVLVGCWMRSRSRTSRLSSGFATAGRVVETSRARRARR